MENEEQTERPGGLFQPLSVCCSEEKIAEDKSGLAVSSVLNREPESNCNSVLCSKGKFL